MTATMNGRAPSPPRSSWRPQLMRAAKITTLLLIVFVTLVPFLLVVMTSLKSKVDSVSLPPKWFFTPTFEHYIEQLANEDFFRAAVNSLVIASATTLIATHRRSVISDADRTLRLRDGSLGGSPSWGSGIHQNCMGARSDG